MMILMMDNDIHNYDIDDDDNEIHNDDCGAENG